MERLDSTLHEVALLSCELLTLQCRLVHEPVPAPAQPVLVHFALRAIQCVVGRSRKIVQTPESRTYAGRPSQSCRVARARSQHREQPIALEALRGPLGYCFALSPVRPERARAIRHPRQVYPAAIPTTRSGLRRDLMRSYSDSACGVSTLLARLRWGLGCRRTLHAHVPVKWACAACTCCSCFRTCFTG